MQTFLCLLPAILVGLKLVITIVQHPKVDVDNGPYVRLDTNRPL